MRGIGRSEAAVVSTVAFDAKGSFDIAESFFFPAAYTFDVLDVGFCDVSRKFLAEGFNNFLFQ